MFFEFLILLLNNTSNLLSNTSIRIFIPSIGINNTTGRFSIPPVVFSYSMVVYSSSYQPKSTSSLERFLFIPYASGLPTRTAVPASLLVWYISCLYKKNVPLGTLFLWEAGGICRCKDRHFSFNFQVFWDISAISRPKSGFTSLVKGYFYSFLG